jgi:hypothetical protein
MVLFELGLLGAVSTCCALLSLHRLDQVDRRVFLKADGLLGLHGRFLQESFFLHGEKLVRVLVERLLRKLRS